jgi:DNA-binding transcriptional ArsR family regulator
LTPAGTPGSADHDLDPGFEPEEVRYIRDVETLKALSDPTRVRILEVMAQRRSPAWSVKEIAAALGVPQTRLYHHVDLLLAQDLLRPVERRVVSGIIETRYVPSARSYQLDRSLFAGAGAEGLAVLHETMMAVFDTARSEVERAIRAGAAEPGDAAPDDRRLLVTRGIAHLTPARAAELRRRLQALTDEFGGGQDAEDAEGARTFGVVLAVYPLLDPAEPSDA